MVEKVKTHVLRPLNFFLKSYYRVWDKVEKYGTAGQATDDNIIGYSFSHAAYLRLQTKTQNL